MIRKIMSTHSCTGSPRVLTNISSSDIKAKEGDLVNLLCSAQGEPPITFSWKKDQKSLDSFMEKEQPHRSSLLLVKVKDESSFGKYTCIRDRFQSTVHTILVQKEICKGNILFSLLMLHEFYESNCNQNRSISCTQDDFYSLEEEDCLSRIQHL